MELLNMIDEIIEKYNLLHEFDETKRLMLRTLAYELAIRVIKES